VIRRPRIRRVHWILLAGIVALGVGLTPSVISHFRPRPPEEPELTRLPSSTDAQGVVAYRRRVDWPATRNVAQANEGNIAAPAQAQEVAKSSPVPVLTLHKEAAPLLGGVAKETKYMRTDNGYLALLAGRAIDIAISGSDVFFALPPGMSLPNAEPQQSLPGNIYSYRYETTESGARVSFGRFGANYLMTFTCEDSEKLRSGCISAEAARTLVSDMVVVERRR
jgi:hypothetical protein